MKKTFFCACALLAAAVAAKSTEFTGTGAWNTTARWSNGVPGSGDTATVSGTSTVTADGLDVIYNTLKLGNVASDNTVYRQKGGTLTSEYLTEVGAALSASTMELENVGVTLNAYRLVVGRGKNARFAMQGGTLTQNLTANNCGLLTGVWAKNGTAEIVLSNVVWNLTGGRSSSAMAASRRTAWRSWAGGLTAGRNSCSVPTQRIIKTLGLGGMK